MIQTLPVPDAIRAKLSVGEQVIWYGQPRQGLMLRAGNWFLVPASLLWGGLAIFWEWSVLHDSQAPPFFGWIGIPLVLIGLYLIVGRFFADAWARGRTHYALTGERVLIVDAGRMGRSRVQSLNLRTLPARVLVTQNKDGFGAISFGSAPVEWWLRLVVPVGWSLMGLPMPFAIPPQLEMIPDAKRVYQLIREAQQRALEGRGEPA